MMLSVLLVLCLSASALSHTLPERRGGCENPSELIDQLLESSKQHPDSDSSELDDIQLKFEYEGEQGQVKLGKGKMSGLTKRARRQGEALAFMQEGRKCLVETMLYYPRLEVEYDEVDVQADHDLFRRKYRDDKPEGYEGSLFGYKAYLRVEYDERSGKMKMQAYAGKKSEEKEFRLKGAEHARRENPMVERELLKQIEKAAAKALEKQMKETAEGYGSH